MISLPHPLADALTAELRDVDPRRLRRLGASLSDTYRAGGVEGRRVVRDADTARAYAAWHLPQTHAHVRAALAALAERRPEWDPRSLLDLGAGPGTAAWATLGTWDSIERITCVEREAELVALGRRLAAASGVAALEEATWRRESLERLGSVGEADLVVLAHVLSELPAGQRSRVLERAWSATADTLVVVEPGTPAGFAVVDAARDALRGVLRSSSPGGSADALRGTRGRTLAPCPHDEACPLVDDWCHLSERAERPAAQRRVKSASLPYEDVKFSYAVLTRADDARPAAARVIRAPRRSKGLVELDLCTSAGLRRVRVSKSRGQAHRRAVKLSWGDAIETPAEIGLDRWPDAADE